MADSVSRNFSHNDTDRIRCGSRQLLTSTGCRPPKVPLGCVQPDAGCRTQSSAPRRPLDVLVTEFLQKSPKSLSHEHRSYQAMSAGQAFERACFAKREDGKREDHQRRLRHAALDAAYRVLKYENWDGLTFEEIHDKVSRGTANIRGLGPLYKYDTATRIGHFHGVAPTKVYLHAGTRKGAQALGLDTRRPWLNLKELPVPLQRLKAWQVEDFLCLYKKQLKA